MNFLNLTQLVEAIEVHDQFQHEIKGKRIKKELANLQNYVNDNVNFKRYFISGAGLSFFIETHVNNKIFDFEILLDFEYPFNRPKIFFIHENSPFSFGQDLLDSILEGNNWGPSMLLSTLFDKLHFIANFIEKDNEQLKAIYQIGDQFDEEILIRYKVELFDIEEFRWKYMIKSTINKILGLTRENLLVFTREEGNKLKLELNLKIKDLKEANASIFGDKFKLDIVCLDKVKYYFGGNKEDIEKILYFMNPIQVTERKLSKPEKEYKSQQLQNVIKEYSDLIEYYSLRDQEKTKKYVNLVQELIKKNYENQSNEIIPQKQFEDLKEEQIKT